MLPLSVAEINKNKAAKTTEYENKHEDLISGNFFEYRNNQKLMNIISTFSNLRVKMIFNIKFQIQ